MSDSGSQPEPAETRAAEGPVPIQPPPASPSAGRPGAAPAKDPLRGSRASGIWVAVVALVVLLILLSIFILQNTQPVEVTYFGAEAEAPLAAALLIAVAAGLLIAVVAGSLRILQLRRRVRHEQKR
jgi:uncharacterized integral membrane protein